MTGDKPRDQPQDEAQRKANRPAVMKLNARTGPLRL